MDPSVQPPPSDMDEDDRPFVVEQSLPHSLSAHSSPPDAAAAAAPLRVAPAEDFADMLGFNSPPAASVDAGGESVAAVGNGGGEGEMSAFLSSSSSSSSSSSAAASAMDLSRSQEIISAELLSSQQFFQQSVVLGAANPAPAQRSSPVAQQQSQQSAHSLQSQSPGPVAASSPSAAASPGAAAPHSSSSHSAAPDHPMGVASSPSNAQVRPPLSPPAQPPQPPPAVILPLELPQMRELPPIKLGRTPKERTLYEQLGDLYSLIVTTEHIETAYVRDAISEQAYTSMCSKLIAQYKTLRESLGDHAPDLETFCRDYSLECRAAENRFKVGIPATVIHGDRGPGRGGPGGPNAVGGGGGSGGGGGEAKMELAVFHAVQHFITAMDSLKLQMRAVDELHPTLSELMDSINAVPSLPPTHESKTKTLAWLTTLHHMKAHEELTEEQARQMSFDLDSAYNAFHRFIQGK